MFQLNVLSHMTTYTSTYTGLQGWHARYSVTSIYLIYNHHFVMRISWTLSRLEFWRRWSWLFKYAVQHSSAKSEVYAYQNCKLPDRGSNRPCVQNLNSLLLTRASDVSTLIQCLHMGLHNPSVWLAVKALRCKLPLKYQQNSFVFVCCMKLKCERDIKEVLKYMS
jgi:hypothetical protein